jgi:alanyl-tRNA synthetase
MFTIAGMVQFKPYFLDEQAPPSPRITTVQPCFRMVDIDLIGTTSRHETIFEMLGNFSFGDYFKEEAIPFAWKFVTEVLGFEKDRLWVTVHESDTDASGIWQEAAGVGADRIQKMGADNFWQMGETGPCGPCSEIYYDRGPDFGEGGGPARGSDARYIEIWNLVFTQFEREVDGTLTDLPRKNIDTGAGMERMLFLSQGVDSLFETDLFVPLIDEASRLTGVRMGDSDRGDIALRILADHARSMTMLISDGVFPSNEGRGYTLRRVIRRAVMRAYQFGVDELITTDLVAVAVASLKNAYPKLAQNETFVQTIVSHEEEAFRRTLRSGTLLIEEELAKGTSSIDGEVAFKLHDTFGFPIDLTVEFASERGVDVDREGFNRAMDEQRSRARLAGKVASTGAGAGEQWKAVVDSFGATNFVGYDESRVSATVLAIVDRDDANTFTNFEGENAPTGKRLIDVVLDITPFYAEGGGQIGDSGLIRAANGTVRVLDTSRATEGLTKHTGYFVMGELHEGDEVIAEIDVERRAAIRRNHTATHLLQHALREVLGDHVKQQGSLVGPDRLRFDFSHFGPLISDERTTVEGLVNAEILKDLPVRIYETSKAEAEGAGAVAFFGDKYGAVVRVVEAGESSIELCGGTHVDALGMIGSFRIVSESSIGANTRRLEAATGTTALKEADTQREILERAAMTLRTQPGELEATINRLVEHNRELEDQITKLKGAQLGDEAKMWRESAANGTLVFRRDKLDAASMRELALMIRAQGVERLAIVGTPDGEKVALVVALGKNSPFNAKEIASLAAKAIGGGGGGSSELATAGGRDVSMIDECVSQLGDLLQPAG